jgi:hypothetical protein
MAGYQKGVSGLVWVGAQQPDRTAAAPPPQCEMFMLGLIVGKG